MFVLMILRPTMRDGSRMRAHHLRRAALIAIPHLSSGHRGPHSEIDSNQLNIDPQALMRISPCGYVTGHYRDKASWATPA